MAYAWIKHKTEQFESVQFVQEVSGGNIEVRNSSGQSLYIKPEQILGSVDDESELHQAPDDLVMLDKIDEPSILQALRTRFLTDRIYTNIGDILISVNPFKLLPMYNPTIMQEYLGSNPSEMPPHVYAVAAAAYNGLIDSDDHASQSVLISGESGAGKTEATKLVLSYLSEAAGSESGMIEQRILAANPILEAFGNAKTLRNNNSSRFGKFVQLNFDGRGKIVGCETKHYLLEKTRITTPGPNERSFHVFYQLLSGSAENDNQQRGGGKGNGGGDLDGGTGGGYEDLGVTPKSKRSYSILPPQGSSSNKNGRQPTSLSATLDLLEQQRQSGLDWSYLGLNGMAAEQSVYLKKSNCVEVEGVSDLDELSDLHAGLVNLGLNPDERNDLMGLTASVLNLGQLRFSAKGGFEGGSQVEPSGDVQACMGNACKVLGLTSEDLSRCLTIRELVIRGESQLIQQDEAQASDSRDALAKALYSANFDWVVARVNKATAASGNWNKVRKAVIRLAKLIKSGELNQDAFFRGEFAHAQSGGIRFSAIGAGAADTGKTKKGGAGNDGMWKDTRSIGILDIFGFEIFDKNSFEQLCINYANERLQQLFNMATFRAEEDAYRAEGVPFEPVMFADNQDVLDLIDKKPSGILPLLDEEVVLPRTTDDTFLRKLGETHEKKHCRYERPRGSASRTGFAVLHYAGSVTYRVEGFLQKNKDELSLDLVAMLQRSSNAHVQALFNNRDKNAAGASGSAPPPPAQPTGVKAMGNRFNGAGGGGGGGGAMKKQAKATQGALFRRQVDELMSALGKTHPSFIRCIKPNPNKHANSFNGLLCYEQLQCSGVFEAVTIRRQGYPARMSHLSFFRRFRNLASLSPDPSALQALKTCKGPEGSGVVPEDAKLAATTLLTVLSQQPALASIRTECHMGKTQVLWRTDVNKAITVVRAAVEKKAATRCQSLARMLLARHLTEVMFALRHDLRRAIEYNGDNDKEVTEVERLLKESKDAPFQMREHYLLSDKFKIIIKRRRVAASIDEMSTRTIDGVDDDFVSVCIAAKELDFAGDAANKLYALYALFTERQSALVSLRRAIEARPQIDVSALEAALAHAQGLKPKFGAAFCAVEEAAATEALRLIAVEEATLTALIKVLELDPLTAGDPRAYGKPSSAEEASGWLASAQQQVGAACVPGGSASAVWLEDSPARPGFPDLRLRAVLQVLVGSGAVGPGGSAQCRTKRGAALVPLGVFAYKLRSTYVDAVFEAINARQKRPGQSANYLDSINASAAAAAALLSESGVGGVGKKPLEKKASAAVLKLRMRTLETSLTQAGSQVDVFSAAKPDHASWDKLGPILTDAKDLMDASSMDFFLNGLDDDQDQGQDQQAGGNGAASMRESVQLFKKAASAAGAAGGSAVGAEVEAIHRALKADLAVADKAKRDCVGALDLAFAVVKDAVPNEDKVRAALAALEEVASSVGPVGLTHLAELRATLEEVVAENGLVEQLFGCLKNGMLCDPVEDILPQEINTDELRRATKAVEDFCGGLVESRSAKARGLSSPSLLLQPKNQTILRVAHYIARLREAIKYALSISDTTQSEKFAEAKAAWIGVQSLLLEASTKVEGLHTVDLDDMTSARQLLLKRSVSSDVKDKLVEATTNQWEDWLEFSLFQAEQLGLDYHEDQEMRDAVANARAVYSNIVATKQSLVDAIAEVDRRSPKNLRLAVSAAKRIGWANPKVEEAVLLETNVASACLAAHNAWQQLDRQVLKDAVEQCKALSVDSSDVHFCEFLLAGHEKTFLQKAHKLFQFLGRSDMVTDITMVMKDIFFENVGDMFQLRHFPLLRTSEEFGRAASSMGFRNTEVAAGMLLWSNAGLPTSLTKAVLVDNPKMNELMLKKVMKQLWQCVQGYMGDVVLSYPSMLAQEVLRIAIEYPALKDEIYCLVLKQVTKNPSPSSEAKAMDLLQICLQSFAPSDVFVNYLEFFLRQSGSTGLVRQLHLMSAEANCQEDKTLSLADIGKVTGLMVHSGWMQLRSEGMFNSYTKYWFLMDPEAGKLRYFTQEANLKQSLKQKQLACLDVSQMTGLDELQPSEKASRNPSIRGKFPFEMSMGNSKSKVRLVSDSEADRATWMAALRAAKNVSWTRGDDKGGEQ